MPATTAERPLLRRYPALAALPRAALCALPTPLQRVAAPDGRSLLLKRDDLTAAPFGGNKARGLEFALGAVRPGDHVVTVGPTGSNSALATATFAASLGATTTVVRWRQHLNPAARAVDARMRCVARIVDAWHAVPAYAIATAMRLRSRTTWVPAGGASPLAVLGHVNAALELAEQLRAESVAAPTRIFVPFGTGGTAAGLALGFRIAGLRVPVTAVRVVPRVVGRLGRVVSLANSTASLIERRTGEFVARVERAHVAVEHGFYGGEYGRPRDDAPALHAWARAAGFALDDTYSLKTAAAALASGEPRPLLWLTFDGRVLDARATTPGDA